MERGWYYKFYLWLNDFFSTLKVNGDLMSYSESSVSSHGGFLHIFLPSVIMLYTVCMIFVTLADFFNSEDVEISKDKFSYIDWMTFFKYVTPFLLLSYIINFTTMILVFWIAFLFNQIGWTIIFFLLMLVLQLISRFGDDWDNESVFNIVPSIASYVHGVLYYYNTNAEYTVNYNKIKNKRLWKI